ncbi:MAG: GNAT family N-acetyltransferase, partial [Oscillospiraceae bacterium]
MLRKMNESDREFFLKAADEFYHSDAVEKPLPLSRLEADFDEAMRSDVYLEGLIFEYGGERAGYCLMTKTFHTEAGLTLWIEDIYILEQYRGKGLG